jgi:hypothetical protein
VEELRWTRGDVHAHAREEGVAQRRQRARLGDVGLGRHLPGAHVHGLAGPAPGRGLDQEVAAATPQLRVRGRPHGHALEVFAEGEGAAGRAFGGGVSGDVGLQRGIGGLRSVGGRRGGIARQVRRKSVRGRRTVGDAGLDLERLGVGAAPQLRAAGQDH